MKNSVAIAIVESIDNLHQWNYEIKIFWSRKIVLKSTKIDLAQKETNSQHLKGLRMMPTKLKSIPLKWINFRTQYYYSATYPICKDFSKKLQSFESNLQIAIIPKLGIKTFFASQQKFVLPSLSLDLGYLQIQF